jgi:2-dehydropantoate 2-reductase
MRIAIMGAGGLGSYLGAQLAAAGADVGFVARGPHLAAMQSDGLRVESPNGNLHLHPVRAGSDPAEIGPSDFVIFAVKLWDTETAAAALAPLIGPETLVVTVQNGIDSADMLARHIPAEQVVAGGAYVSVHMLRPGVVGMTGTCRVIVDAKGGDPRLAALAALGKPPGLSWQLADDASSVLWQKFVTLVAFSGATALTRMPLGRVRGNPETLQILEGLFRENIAVARAAGHPLPPRVETDTWKRLMAHSADAMASMAVDLTHGRRLELPWLSGRVHQLGLELGVPTPTNTMVYRALLLHADGHAATA